MNISCFSVRPNLLQSIFRNSLNSYHPNIIILVCNRFVVFFISFFSNFSFSTHTGEPADSAFIQFYNRIEKVIFTDPSFFWYSWWRILEGMKLLRKTIGIALFMSCLVIKSLFLNGFIQLNGISVFMSTQLIHLIR